MRSRLATGQWPCCVLVTCSLSMRCLCCCSFSRCVRPIPRARFRHVTLAQGGPAAARPTGPHLAPSSRGGEKWPEDAPTKCRSQYHLGSGYRRRRALWSTAKSSDRSSSKLRICTSRCRARSPPRRQRNELKQRIFPETRHTAVQPYSRRRLRPRHFGRRVRTRLVATR
jgi:hypothetical protein